MTDEVIPHEAEIIINGIKLTEGQSMTVRVACWSFFLEMEKSDALGDDYHGRSMVKAYKERLEELMTLILKKEKKNG